MKSKARWVSKLSIAHRVSGRGDLLGALDPASGLWGAAERAGGKILDSMINGRAGRSAEDIRGGCGYAVTRQGRERDELLKAIMGYGTRKAAGAAETARDEEVLRAILGGDAMAVTAAYAC